MNLINIENLISPSDFKDNMLIYERSFYMQAKNITSKVVALKIVLEADKIKAMFQRNEILANMCIFFSDMFFK